MAVVSVALHLPQLMVVLHPMAADTAAAADPTATHPEVAVASPGGKFLFGGASAPFSTFYGLGNGGR
jgi:hypothetical protein